MEIELRILELTRLLTAYSAGGMVMARKFDCDTKPKLR